MSSARNNEPNEVKEAASCSSTVLDILFQRGYSILGKIGKGSYANVFVSKYKSPSSDKTIVLACKLIDTKKVPKAYVKKFLPREIAALRQVNHPNIIAVHSIFQQSTFYFIFMSFASKGDLLTFITKNGAIREQQAYTWFRQLSEALRYLHNLDIAHRDLKCENLLLSSQFVIKLTDFGFSRSAVDERGHSIKSKTFCGSLSYAPPEVISGIPYDPRVSDMWSLGVTLYVMLNKAMPFDDSNIKKAHENQVNNQWYFRAKVKNLLSDDVKHVVQRLLQPNVEDRWKIDDVFTSRWFVKNMDISFAGVDEDSDAQYTGRENVGQRRSQANVRSATSSVRLLNQAAGRKETMQFDTLN